MKDAKHNRHHILARVRGGKNKKNIVVLPRDFHSAIHTVFGVLTPSEMKEFLDIVLVPNTSWTWKQIEEVRNRLMQRTC